MQEEWRDVVGFDGYQVSNFGNVRSFKNNRHGLTNVAKVLKLGCDRYGYSVVYLCRNGVDKCVRVHHIEASAFLINPESKEFVDHIDGNKQNNRLDNLRWVTRKENNNNPLSCKRHGKAMEKFIGHKRPVICIETGEFFDSISEASRKIGTPNTRISLAAMQRLKRAGGYHWRHATPEEVARHEQGISCCPVS